MRILRQIIPALLFVMLWVADAGAQAQAARDSAAAKKYPWRDSVRSGSGPSVGPPPSDYTGKTPPGRWCLAATRRATGDLGVSQESWDQVSRSWLRQVLSDTTDWGAMWRRVLGGAPTLSATDRIVQIVDEDECRAVAELIDREILGWSVSPPPVVIYRVRDFLIAYPSNMHLGEWGLAVGMSRGLEIRGAAAW